MESDAVVKQCASIPAGLSLAGNFAAFVACLVFFPVLSNFKHFKNQCKTTDEKWAAVH